MTKEHTIRSAVKTWGEKTAQLSITCSRKRLPFEASTAENCISEPAVATKLQTKLVDKSPLCFLWDHKVFSADVDVSSYYHSFCSASFFHSVALNKLQMDAGKPNWGLICRNPGWCAEQIPLVEGQKNPFTHIILLWKRRRRGKIVIPPFHLGFCPIFEQQSMFVAIISGIEVFYNGNFARPNPPRTVEGFSVWNTPNALANTKHRGGSNQIMYGG